MLIISQTQTNGKRLQFQAEVTFKTMIRRISSDF